MATHVLLRFDAASPFSPGNQQASQSRDRAHQLQRSTCSVQPSLGPGPSCTTETRVRMTASGKLLARWESFFCFGVLWRWLGSREWT